MGKRRKIIVQEHLIILGSRRLPYFLNTYSQSWLQMAIILLEHLIILCVVVDDFIHFFILIVDCPFNFADE